MKFNTSFSETLNSSLAFFSALRAGVTRTKELFVMKEYEHWYDKPLDGTFVIIMVAAAFTSIIIIGAFAQHP